MALFMAVLLENKCCSSCKRGSKLQSPKLLKIMDTSDATATITYHSNEHEGGEGHLLPDALDTINCLEADGSSDNWWCNHIKLLECSNNHRSLTEPRQ